MPLILIKVLVIVVNFYDYYKIVNFSKHNWLKPNCRYWNSILTAVLW